MQAILGHKYVDTTLAYSRVYDTTVAADYYRAMGQIEGAEGQPVNGRDLVALLDVLRAGELDGSQQQAAQTLRAAIQSLDLAGVSVGENDGSVTNSV